ncbi:reverse transcriptase domain-containing protein [Campylobacter gastrosuis]|uniref:Reverse transcriptase domain-containing protein n=1 Tax=Campylobacter gastrosuis TaxID=2974576 RepID=A0ABT7HRW2_9BACT|nr:reverse transcriptase domain-containing protein [Campylobacter gastrosuis]MDL0089641.1 reverse transcriptase domain-containing protein [Campylobacter gastrosuis]
MMDLFSLELEQFFTNDTFLNATKRLKHVSLGLDGLKIDEVCFGKLKDEILSQTYAPTPLKELFIPKENKNELRHLGIPSFKDKIAQNMLAFELNKYFDKLFSSSSYAYRQGKSYKNAVFRARDFFRKYSHVIKTDIKDFFESINHEILLEILNVHIVDKRIIRLITLWIKNGEFLRYSYFKHHKGVHQGDVLSPLLSNIYLNQMDKFLEQNGLDFVRYADDFVIFTVSEQDATNTLKMLKNFLLTIKLNLNQNKTAIHDKFSDFTFLGVNFKGDELSISDEKFRQTLAKLSSQIKQQEINTAITNLNAYISHLKTIKLQLFSPEQKENFNAHFNQTITNLVRKFIKILDKKAIADALLNLEFAYPVANTLKKQLLLSYYKNAKLPRVKSITATLEAKKREYLRNFAKDSVLHVTTPFLFLAILQGKFVLKQNGKITHKFPISKINQIIINTQISLSSAVIYECSKRKISIDFIDEKTNLSYATLFTSNNAIPKNTTSQISILKTKKS